MFTCMCTSCLKQRLAGADTDKEEQREKQISWRLWKQKPNMTSTKKKKQTRSETSQRENTVSEAVLGSGVSRSVFGWLRTLAASAEMQFSIRFPSGTAQTLDRLLQR